MIYILYYLKYILIFYSILKKISNLNFFYVLPTTPKNDWKIYFLSLLKTALFPFFINFKRKN